MKKLLTKSCLRLFCLLVACLSVAFSGMAYDGFKLVEVKASGSNYVLDEDNGKNCVVATFSNDKCTIPANSKGKKVMVQGYWDGGFHLYGYKDYDYTVNGTTQMDIWHDDASKISNNYKAFVINTDDSFTVSFEGFSGDQPNSLKFEKVTSSNPPSSTTPDDFDYYFWSGDGNSQNWPGGLSNDIKFTKNAAGDYVLTKKYTDNTGARIFGIKKLAKNASSTNNDDPWYASPSAVTVTKTQTVAVQLGGSNNIKVTGIQNKDITYTLTLSATGEVTSVEVAYPGSGPSLVLYQNDTNKGSFTLQNSGDYNGWYKWTGNLDSGSGFNIKNNNGSGYGPSNGWSNPANQQYDLATGSWSLSKAQTGVEIYVQLSNNDLAGGKIKFVGFDYTTQSSDPTFTAGNTVYLKFTGENWATKDSNNPADLYAEFQTGSTKSTWAKFALVSDETNVYSCTVPAGGPWTSFNLKRTQKDNQGTVWNTLTGIKAPTTSTNNLVTTGKGVDNATAGDTDYSWSVYAGATSDYPATINLYTYDNPLKTWTATGVDGVYTFTVKGYSTTSNNNMWFRFKEVSGNTVKNAWIPSTQVNMEVANGGSYSFYKVVGKDGVNNFFLPAKSAVVGDITITLDLTKSSGQVSISYSSNEPEEKKLYIGGNEFGGIDYDAENVLLEKDGDNYKPVKVQWTAGTQHEFNFYEGVSKSSNKIGVSEITKVKYGTYTTNASGSNANYYDLADLNGKTVWLTVTGYDAENDKVNFTLSQTKPGVQTYDFKYHGTIVTPGVWDATDSYADLNESNNYSKTFNVESISGEQQFGFNYKKTGDSDLIKNSWFASPDDNPATIKADGKYPLKATEGHNMKIDVTDVKSVTLQLVLDDDTNLPTHVLVSLTKTNSDVDTDFDLFITGVENHHNLMEGAAKMEYKGKGLYEYKVGEYNGARFNFCLYDSKNRVYHNNTDYDTEVKVDGTKCNGFTFHEIPEDGNFAVHRDWYVKNGDRKTLKDAVISVNVNEKWVSFSGTDNGPMADYYFVGDMNNWYSDEFTMDATKHSEFKGLSGYRMLRDINKWAFKKDGDVYVYTLDEGVALTGQFQIFGGQSWDEADRRYLHPGNGESTGTYVDSYYSKAINASDDQNEIWFTVGHKNGEGYKQHNLHLAHNAILPESEKGAVKIVLDPTNKRVKVIGKDQDYYIFVVSQEDNDNSGLKAYINSDKPNKNNYWLPAVTVNFGAIQSGHEDFENGHMADGAGVVMTKLTAESTAAELKKVFDTKATEYIDGGDGTALKLTVPSAGIKDLELGTNSLWVVKIPNSFEGPAGTKFRAGLLNSNNTELTNNGEIATWWTVTDNDIVVLPNPTHIHISMESVLNQFGGKVTADQVKIYYRLYGPGRNYKESQIYTVSEDGVNHVHDGYRTISGDARNAFNQSADIRDFGWVELGHEIELVGNAAESDGEAHDVKGATGKWQAAVHTFVEGDAVQTKRNRVNVRTQHQNAYVQFRIDVTGAGNLGDLVVDLNKAKRYDAVRRAADSDVQTIYSPLWMSMGDLEFNTPNEHQLQGVSLYQTLDTNDIVTGIEEMLEYMFGDDLDSDMPVYYYNLQGIRVDNPENGVFIRVKGDRSVKVAL